MTTVAPQQHPFLRKNTIYKHSKNQRMKKIYSFFLCLFALLSLGTAQAREIVTDTTTWVTDLQEIQTGDKLMLYCYGESTRRAFLYEGDDMTVYLSRNFVIGDMESYLYTWTVIDYEAAADGTSAQIKLQSPKGNYFGDFPYDESSTWVKWPGTLSSEASDLTIQVTEGDDAVAGQYYILDGNQVYFNGQNVNDNGIAAFVGWNTAGDNSIYMIKKATVIDKETVTITLEPQDQDQNNILDEGTTQVEIIPGNEVEIPSYAHYTFDHAINEDMEEVELPIVGGDDDAYYTLFYNRWPQVTIVGMDEGGNILYSTEDYYEQGTTFAAPSNSAVAVGYELLTHDYDNHEWSDEDDQTSIILNYRKDVTYGLPFEPTTVTDGQLAADTKYYTLRIRNAGWITLADADASDVTITTAALGADNLELSSWAVTGDLEQGITLYNKVLGAAKKVYVTSDANSTQIQFGTDEEIEAAGGTSLFNVEANSNGGVSLAYRNADGTSSDACMNQFGGSTGTALKFWNSSAAVNDGGSNIVFAEVTAEESESFALLQGRAYLRAEGVVGGYTADQLTDLKAAVAAKDLDAVSAAIDNLNGVETIAFDPSKTYHIISAFNEQLRQQPDAVYAIYADETDTLRWNALDATSDAYQWVFQAASDTTYTITNLAAKKAIVGWRFGDYAVLDGAAELVDPESETVTTWAGAIAPFELVKSDVAPAAYRLVHNYGASIITISGAQGAGDGAATEGYIRTYNTVTDGYANVWHLAPVADVPSSINAATIVNAGQQDQSIYDLSGRRVQNAQKGLYIVGGKKVLVK
jgi:hypothetical protein